MQEEEWRLVPGETHYWVSDLGRMKSTVRGERILCPFRFPHGYCGIRLSNNKRDYIHRLVGKAFLGPPPSPSHQIDHINHERADNRPSNLRWATPSENLRNRAPHERRGHYRTRNGKRTWYETHIVGKPRQEAEKREKRIPNPPPASPPSLPPPNPVVSFD